MVKQQRDRRKGADTIESRLLAVKDARELKIEKLKKQLLEKEMK